MAAKRSVIDRVRCPWAKGDEYVACYAFMQAIGMANDHLVDCFRHAELQSQRSVRKME